MPILPGVLGLACLFIAVFDVESRRITVSLKRQLRTDTTYFELPINELHVVSHFPKDGTKGATFTHGGPFEIKVAEINTHNLCNSALLASNVAMLICSNELYLLDAISVTRNNYYQLPESKAGKSQFKSWAAFGSNIILLSHDGVNTGKVNLTYVNCYDSTINPSFSSMLHSFNFNGHPAVKYHEVDETTIYLLTYATQRAPGEFLETAPLLADFLLTPLNSVGMPLKKSKPRIYSLFDPHIFEHRKTTFLEIISGLEGRLYFFYLIDLEDYSGLQVSYIDPIDEIHSYNWENRTGGTIAFPEGSLPAFKTEKTVLVRQITKTLVLFYYPIQNRLLVCGLVVPNGPMVVDNIAGNCTNDLEIEVQEQENAEILSITQVIDLGGAYSFLLEVKHKVSGMTLRSVEYKVIPDKGRLEKKTEWFIESKCHLLSTVDQGSYFLLSLRDRYVESYLNFTNYVKLEIGQLVDKDIGTRLLLVIPPEGLLIQKQVTFDLLGGSPKSVEKEMKLSIFFELLPGLKEFLQVPMSRLP